MLPYLWESGKRSDGSTENIHPKGARLGRPRGVRIEDRNQKPNQKTRVLTGAMFIVGAELSDWQTGNYDIIREYMKPIPR